MKSSVEQAMDMVRNERLVCPICGWSITTRTDPTILAEAVDAHVREHQRLKGRTTFEEG
jgi:hypothetical protein